jgi:hypothetical protein
MRRKATLKSEEVVSAVRQATIDDLFHALSQPLTTLSCFLEVCLRESGWRPDRHQFSIALQQVRTIMDLTARIRDLIEREEAQKTARSHLTLRRPNQTG